jgi:general secretion pathway protein B
MSFILDALKKSENDRQQQSNAEFASVPTSPVTPSIPRWVWIAGFLLAINLAVLIVLLLKPGPAPLQSSVPSLPEAIDTPHATTEPASSFEERVATAELNPPDQQLDDAATMAIEAPTQLVSPVLISQNPSAIPKADLYPSIQEVRASGLSSLPDLHLDIHVYGEEPKDRFVFINMAKSREGSQLAEGPTVREITPDGVLLEHQGQSFLLPRD